MGHDHTHDWRPVPILPSRDAATATAFWQSLGFRVVDAMPGDEWPYLIAVQEGAELHFVHNPDVDADAGWFRCYIAVEDVDALAERWSALGLPAEGLPSMGAPELKPWGLREVWVTDPDGTVVRFGSAG